MGENAKIYNMTKKEFCEYVEKYKCKIVDYDAKIEYLISTSKCTKLESIQKMYEIGQMDSFILCTYNNFILELNRGGRN